MAVGINWYQVWSAAAILHVEIVTETEEEDLPDLAWESPGWVPNDSIRSTQGINKLIAGHP